MMKNKIFVVLVLMFLAGCSQSGRPEAVARKEKTVVREYSAEMVLVGDALLHMTVVNDALQADGSYDFSSQLQYMKPIIEQFDIAFYNQETVLGGVELGLSGYPQFNSPQEFGDNMLNLGFNLVSLANNHSYDKYEKGVVTSLAYWQQQDVNYSGMAASEEERSQGVIFQCNNITFGFLAYTEHINGLQLPQDKQYLVNIYSDERMRSDIEALRPQVDVLLVSVHFGSEYTHSPTPEQLRVANLLAELDVDIVIGHHPHVIQPIAYIDDTLVFYSLGNFISAQQGEQKLVEMIAALTINKTITNGEVEITIDNVRADLLYNYYDSSYHNFAVYFLAEMPEGLLPDYLRIYEKYLPIITQLDDSIEIGGIGL